MNESFEKRIEEIRKRAAMFKGGIGVQTYSQDVEFLLDIIDRTIDSDIIINTIEVPAVSVPASYVMLTSMLYSMMCSRGYDNVTIDKIMTIVRESPLFKRSQENKKP